MTDVVGVVHIGLGPIGTETARPTDGMRSVGIPDDGRSFEEFLMRIFVPDLRLGSFFPRQADQLLSPIRQNPAIGRQGAP